MVNSEEKREMADKSQIHYDSILALEALLDIKKSPSLKPVQSNTTKVKLLPISECLKQRNKPSSSENIPSRPAGTKFATNLVEKSEGDLTSATPSLLRNHIDASSNSVMKPIAPSPSLSLHHTGSSATANPIYHGVTLKSNIPKKTFRIQNQLRQPFDTTNTPVNHVKNSFISGLPNSPSIAVQPAIPPWITVQSSQSTSNLTSDIPEITGLVPNPLDPKPEHVLSRGSLNSSSSNIGRKEYVSKVPIIRATEVEAALRSKPQRGRKRENLTVLERLELTRTRNREHAKSTRIRKKARYQELLDSEKIYHNFLKEIELKENRKQGIYNFLKLRTRILMNTSWPDDLNFSSTRVDHSSSAILDRKNNDIRKVSMNCEEMSKDMRNSHGLLSCNSTAPVTMNIDDANENLSETFDIETCPLHQALNFVLHDPTDFRVILRTPLPNHRSHANNNGIEKLRDYDNTLRDQVKNRFGPQVAPTIKFIIPDSFMEDISFSKSTCYAKYNLVASIPCPSNCEKTTDAACFTGLIRASFYTGSHKVTSIEMWSNMDCAQNLKAAGGNAPYNVIYSFPSVVSLDVTQGDHSDCNRGLSKTQSNNTNSLERKESQNQTTKQNHDHVGLGIDLDSCSYRKL